MQLIRTSSSAERSPRARAIHVPLLAVLLTSTASAQQVRFSVDSTSTTATLIDTTGTPITPECVLIPDAGAPMLGPLAVPRVLYQGADLLLPPPAWELDALSHGVDPLFDSHTIFAPGSLWFSVDRRSLGKPFPATWPTVRSEVIPRPDREAAQDVFVNLDATAPLIGIALGRHVAVLDGDGLPSATSGFAYPGVGLVEPGPADNLDALDIVDPAETEVYFSVSRASAVAHAGGYRGGDVLLVDTAAAVPTLAVYATAAQLGLDLMGANSDELDALVVYDNGDDIYTAVNGWAGWGAADDRLLFSVSRTSALIGQLDGFLGLAIEPGDILMPPGAGMVAKPGIFITAEQLGLRTNRLALPNLSSDELDALDLLDAPLFDCNGNDIEDAVDIASGASIDVDMDGAPDECEPVVFCTASVNSCGSPMSISATGVSSASAASGFVVRADHLEASSTGLLLHGTLSPGAPLITAFGYLCVDPHSSKSTAFSIEPGTAGLCDGAFWIDMNTAGAAFGYTAGETVYCQFYAEGPMGWGKFTDALQFLVGP